MDKDLTITVRSYKFDIFSLFFRSFLNFNNEYFKNLVVHVDSQSESLDKYYILQDYTRKKNCSNLFGIKVVDMSGLYDETFSKMLYESLAYPKVISFDDDIVFLKSGLFECLSGFLQKEKIIIGENANTTSGVTCMSSWIIGKKGIDFVKEDFIESAKERQESLKITTFDGIDTFRIYLKYAKNCFFIDDAVNKKTSKIRSSSVTDYYTHVSGSSLLYRNAQRVLKDDFSWEDDNKKKKG